MLIQCVKTMKKRVIIHFYYLFLSVVLAVPTFAQPSLGIYFSYDNTRYSGDIPSGFKYEFKGGYSIGVSSEFKIAEDVYLCLRPAYGSNGSNVSTRIDTLFVDEDLNPIDSLFIFDINTRAVNLPILFKVMVNKSFYAIAGAYTSYVLTADANVAGFSKEVLPQMSRFQVQSAFGFGFKLPIKRSLVNIELTYVQSLNTVTKTRAIEEREAPRLRNQGLTASLHFLIPTTKPRP
mgnify:CR=1 FL=1